MAKVKETKKKDVKKKEKEVKKTSESYITGVRKEMKQVKWPTFKEVIKYTVATIIFIAVFVLFFQLINLIMAYVKGLFN
jgi:preprotein translocase SecE subunit